ncbi:hypothetical protein [Tahibacter sp.]|uniref:hypothetical protein n=1 Tax=Tahibacter sp. TaxID=2056211 RepID=UPI0028C3C723|nr:hypothetical protein [Tahibacter sp.]
MAAAAAAADQFLARSHGALARTFHVAGTVGMVTVAYLLWHQQLHRLASQLILWVPEQPLSLRVGQHDASVAGDHDHGVGCRLEQRAIKGRGRFAGDVQG